MWKILLICAIVAGCANAAQRKRYISSGSGSSAGSSSGGYSGNYAPEYGFADPYEFHQRLTQQILSQQAAQNRALTSTYASDDASAYAEASNYPDENEEAFQEQFARQRAYFDNLQRQNYAAAAGGGSYGGGSYSGDYAPNYASASGYYSPAGAYQSASIYPENPSIPNINSRFSEPSGGGFGGVSVSSYSSSSDINGKKTSHRGATTTINDNGKVTTYRVHS